MARQAVQPTSVTLLRIPGIYAVGREGGDPRDRLRRGSPVLAVEHDVFTNHIHADDLARACVAALHRGLPQRIVHASDDTELKMGDYFDLAADLCGMPRPPRITRPACGAVASKGTSGFRHSIRSTPSSSATDACMVFLSAPST